MKSKLLLVDFYNVLWRGMSMNMDLTTENGETFTGGLYGFVIMMGKMIRDHKPKAMIICMDAPPYIRQELYPEYKGDRPKPGQEEELKEGEISKSQLKNWATAQCLKFIEMMQWPIAIKDGFEADDMIAHFAQAYYDDFDEIIINSNDDDLYQLLDDDLVIQIARNNALFTNDHFKEKYQNISKEQLITLLALTGTHNAVKGIHGIGPVRALKAVQSSVEMFRLREHHHGLIERNESLIKLPWAGLEDYDLPSIFVPTYNENNLQHFLTEYEIRMNNKMRESFEWIGDRVHQII